MQKKPSRYKLKKSIFTFFKQIQLQINLLDYHWNPRRQRCAPLFPHVPVFSHVETVIRDQSNDGVVLKAKLPDLSHAVTKAVVYFCWKSQSQILVAFMESWSNKESISNIPT